MTPWTGPALQAQVDKQILGIRELLRLWQVKGQENGQREAADAQKGIQNVSNGE